MLVVQELGATRGGATLFSGVSLRVESGAAILLRGPNGSGKTTFLRAVAGVAPADHGEVLLHGRPVTSWPRWKRERVAPFVDQDPLLDLEVLSIDNLVDALLQTEWWHWWATSKKRARQAAKREAQDLLAVVGLEVAVDRKAWELSYGQRRLLTLVRALRLLPGNGARLLLLDEPFAGLREDRARALVELLNSRLKAGWGLIVAEHLPIVNHLEITGELEFPALRA